MTKFRITYDSINGDATPDGLCGGLVDELISMSEFGVVSYVTSSASVITAFRLAAAEQKIGVDDVIFLFNGDEITMDNNFELSAWPLGFADPQGPLLNKIMQIRREARNGLI